MFYLQCRGKHGTRWRHLGGSGQLNNRVKSDEIESVGGPGEETRSKRKEGTAYKTIDVPAVSTSIR